MTFLPQDLYCVPSILFDTHCLLFKHTEIGSWWCIIAHSLNPLPSNASDGLLTFAAGVNGQYPVQVM